MNVIDYSLAYHRRLSINSSVARVAAIGLFLEWAHEHDIDLDERIGSGELLTLDEVEHLATVLRQSRRRKITVGKGKDKKQVPAAILGKTHADRIDWVTAYIRWRVDSVAQARSIRDPSVPVITERMSRIAEQLHGLKGRGGGKNRLGLTDEQQVRLFQIVHPDSPENPFHKETRYRNFVLLLIYFELGTRRAEPLVLKGQHIQTLGSNPSITIEPNPNDPDEKRTDPPLVKTAGRTLPISSTLARYLHTYTLEHRSKVPGAKKNPFIFLDSEDGRAMSLYAVYDIFCVLRDRFPNDFPPDFSPHIMRHTWNDRFKAACKKQGMNNAEQTQLKNYLMGWTKTSQQGQKYSLRETERQAGILLMQLHQPMTGCAR